MKKEKNTISKKQFSQEAATISRSLFSNEVHMEMTNNTEAIVEGCTGILEYNSDAIRINTGKYAILFKGRNLTLRCMTQDSIIVNGYFLTIEFLV